VLGIATGAAAFGFFAFIAFQAPVPLATNLVQNGDAERGLLWWTARGNAAVEHLADNPAFVLANQGSLQQIIRLPPVAPSQVLVLTATVMSERVNENGSITGLPYLYGLIGDESGVRYLAYLQGMRGQPRAKYEWVKVAGVFPVPDGAARLVLQLNQAQRAGDPQNGSKVWFDKVEALVFATEAAARAANPNLPPLGRPTLPVPGR
jgi:hypothetical protein